MPSNDKRVVEVIKRSGFDKSFRNSLSAFCGTLVPIFIDEVIPDTKVNLKINLATAMAPLVSDTYMNVRLRVEAFAVPHRLCQANFESFFADYPQKAKSDVSDLTQEVDFNACMPLIRVRSNVNSEQNLLSVLTGNSSLFDYFGGAIVSGAYNLDVVSAPFVAYHLIWQEWYRNPRVQKPAFMKFYGSSNTNDFSVGSSNPYSFKLPFYSFAFDANGVQPTTKPNTASGNSDLNHYILADGVNILSLRQRNFGLDYFTSAMVEPQQGDMAHVVVPSADMPSGITGFTIAALRSANSIQQFRERNNLTSPRYQQQIYARYGTAPSDGVIQRPVLIGAASYDVYSHGVTQTSSAFDADAASSGASGPFGGSLGNRAGNGFASGSDFIISGFHAKEPMYIIVLASLVPEVTYAQVENPIWRRYKGLGSISDMANGMLQNVGPEPIYKGQLSAGNPANYSSIFAYSDRYSTWMFKANEVHGELNSYNNGTLKSFVLQRVFGAPPSYGSSFLEIPTSYLDPVLQFDSSTTKCTYWLDIAFDYKVSMPLMEYCIPSLQNPAYEHGKSIVLRKNGQLL